MITPEERKKLRKIIGFRWIARINQYFNKRGIVNRYNMPYTSNYLSRVFNGKIENENVESGIYDLMNKRLQEQEEEKQRRKGIMDKAKNL